MSSTLSLPALKRIAITGELRIVGFDVFALPVCVCVIDEIERGEPVRIVNIAQMYKFIAIVIVHR